LAEHFPIADPQPGVETVQKRLMHLQALESYRCLEENILFKPEDGDIGSIFGWGFPPYTGGALSYIDFTGLANFVEDCEAFAQSYGPRFSVPDSLKNKAANGESIYVAPKEKLKA